MEKKKLLITFWLLFVPVAEMFSETKSLTRSSASAINERMILIVLIVSRVSPPLAVSNVWSEKANTVSLVK
eukprot:SAG31_NODE_1250_length_9118_cov_4.047344_2_plen_71_part_00